jgi:hypothetical protein
MSDKRPCIDLSWRNVVAIGLGVGLGFIAYDVLRQVWEVLW